MGNVDVREISIPETRELRQRVLRPHQTLDQVAADEPEAGIALGAFADGRLIAVGMITDGEDPGVWRVRGMATDAPARGQGAGSAVLGGLVTRAIERGATRVWCNARTPALSLYERAGFRRASEVFELPDVGPHVVMELLIGPN